jgi:serine/threonine-protein kinase HipA
MQAAMRGLRIDGTYRGFEDFCVLSAKRTDQKYSGSYKTSILRRFEQFANSPSVHRDLEKLFTLIALNCVLRNGDAHLKNFGIVYDDVLGEGRLAPVFDLVTTSVYLPKDSMALTLNGSTKWPLAKELQKLGETRAACTPSRVRQILEQIAEAISATATEVRSYVNDNSEFAVVGERMLEEWQTGMAHSLRDARVRPGYYDRHSALLGQGSLD